jgi:hypothetical protein
MNLTNLTNTFSSLYNQSKNHYGTGFSFARIYFFPKLAVPFQVIVVALILLTGLTGTIGNLMVFYIERKRRKMKRRAGPRPFERSLSMYFIKSLALSDLLSCIIHTPLGVLWVFEESIKGDLECKLHIVALMSLSCITILNVTFIAIERYLAVFYPLKAPSVEISKVCVILSWVFGTIVGIVHILPYRSKRFEVGDYLYTVHCVSQADKEVSKVLMAVHTVVMYVIPNMVMCFSAILINRFLRERKRQIHDGIVNATVRSQAWRFKDTKMFMNIIFFFYIPYTLFFVAGVAKEIGEVKFNFLIESIIQLATFMLAFTNCAVNPIIYVTSSKEIRKIAVSLFIY